MLQLHKVLLLVICFLTILSCGRRSNDTTTIDNLVNRFSQLKTTSPNQSVDYNLIRSVSFGKPSITIKLYSQPDSIDDKQEIILVTNSKLYSYAIPLFSNTYRDYWQFQFDRANPDTKPTITTFEKELNICLDTLQLNDTIGTAGKVVNEILYSLLHCQEIHLADSSDFQTVLLRNTYRTLEENTDSCSVRIKLNWKSISEEMYPNKTAIYKHSYWDETNGRIYQFDFKNFKRKQRNYFKLKTFRQQMVWQKTG
jgi:hypothetical protein